MKVYRGFRAYETKQNVYVEVRDDKNNVLMQEYTLPLRLDLFNHSPTGFNWGYPGSGPAQLALAILADYLGSDTNALKLYMAFKFDVIAMLDMDRDFTLSSNDIDRWVKEQRLKAEGKAV